MRRSAMGGSLQQNLACCIDRMSGQCSLRFGSILDEPDYADLGKHAGICLDHRDDFFAGDAMEGSKKTNKSFVSARAGVGSMAGMEAKV